jgi:RHS repeat-associated protein
MPALAVVLGSYSYARMSYANPHAVTQVGNGTATTTYAHDNNANLTSSGNGTATTTYTYDYGNRLTSLFAGGATTTYGYDAFGARVYQIIPGTSTSTYPFKFFSVASTTPGSTRYATTTEYVFNGDTLLSTVDQKIVNGVASGTAAVRYVHPDHLGSTNVVTNENGALVQTLDYYPYGATRVSISTSTNEKRKFIGQFADDSGLSYLNARYYNPTQRQFISQDPVFWEIGLTSDGKRAMANPQYGNSYGYSSDNPITDKDPSGRIAGIDDLAEIGLIELAIPVIRAAIVTGAVNTDFNIAANITQNASQGKLSYNATPGQLLSSFGQGAVFGATAETGAAFLTPFAKMALAARNAKLASQGVSAAGVTVGSDIYNGNTNPWQVTQDASLSGLSTYVGARAVGLPRGSDVKSFSSPLFLSGANMSNASRQGVASQSFQTFATAALSSIVAGLKNVVASLQAQQQKKQ